MAAMFQSRIDAAERLAEALSRYRGRDPLVLAIPRGAVEMGKIVADALAGELDVILVRKLRAPCNPEFAVGSIAENGWVQIAARATAAGADSTYLQQEQEEQLAVMRARRAKYTPWRAPIGVEGRIVIIVDDGLATGATMIAALHAAREKKPALLVAAVPVAARASLDMVRPHADEIVCLETADHFFAVSQFYADFHEVSDDEVISLLRSDPTVPDRPPI